MSRWALLSKDFGSIYWPHHFSRVVTSLGLTVVVHPVSWLLGEMSSKLTSEDGGEQTALRQREELWAERTRRERPRGEGSISRALPDV